jgi:phage-related protein
MSETKRTANEANRMGEEMQERTQRMGREYQQAAASGMEAVSRSFTDANKGFQAMADELNDFSKSRWEAVFQAWEQLLRVRHIG